MATSAERLLVVACFVKAFRTVDEAIQTIITALIAPNDQFIPKLPKYRNIISYHARSIMDVQHKTIRHNYLITMGPIVLSYIIWALLTFSIQVRRRIKCDHSRLEFIVRKRSG